MTLIGVPLSKHMHRLAFLVAVLLANPVMANCYSIRNSDEKNLCLAETKGVTSYCYSIKAADKKNLCLAKVRKDESRRNWCYAIKDTDARNVCLATTK